MASSSMHLRTFLASILYPIPKLHPYFLHIYYSSFLLLVSNSVLVCLGCYNKILYIVWFINSKHLFFTVLNAGMSKIQVLEDSVSVRVCLLVHGVFAVPSHDGSG